MMISRFIEDFYFPRVGIGERIGPESMEWFIEDQVLSLSFDLASPPPSSPLSKLSLFLSLPMHRRSSFLEGRGGRRGGGGTQSKELTRAPELVQHFRL